MTRDVRAALVAVMSVRNWPDDAELPNENDLERAIRGEIEGRLPVFSGTSVAVIVEARAVVDLHAEVLPYGTTAEHPDPDRAAEG